jgi:predicted XRE-type DNA-binding protein
MRAAWYCASPDAHQISLPQSYIVTGSTTGLMRAQLLMGLEHWLEKSRMTQAEAAKVLGVTQARVSDLKRGKINRFSMDLLVRLAARAGLKPKLKLAA